MEKVRGGKPRRKLCRSSKEPQKWEYVEKYGYIPMTLKQWKGIPEEYKGDTGNRRSALALYPSIGTTSQPVKIVSARQFKKMRREILGMPVKFLVTVRVRDAGSGHGVGNVFRIRTGENAQDAMRQACQGYEVISRYVELEGRFILVNLPIIP